MNLKITNCNNFFKIKGILDKHSLEVFEKEFSNIFDKTNGLKISIEGVESMDRYGITAITKLLDEAKSKNKNLSIIGYGSNDLYSHFKTTTAA